ncbi:hypothetical protein [Asanoa sp. NPDC050611]|uniref:hypothetical protein n=1 Tax=Asanoa sp. NPDC050611 TaxID=3157098 RepID=UPI0033FEEB59
MKLPFGMLAVLALATAAGCADPAPSEDGVAFGVTRVGDRYHLRAPLCDGDLVAAVQVVAVRPAEDGATESPQDTWWQVELPVRESIADGAVPLGDDDAFRTVVVPAGSRTPFPKVATVRLWVGRPPKGHEVSGTFLASTVPTYPAGTDLGTVSYVFDSGSGEQRLLTASTISAICQ